MTVMTKMKRYVDNGQPQRMPYNCGFQSDCSFAIADSKCWVRIDCLDVVDGLIKCVKPQERIEHSSVLDFVECFLPDGTS